MTQPSIFISCVTSEFGQTRSRVADILTRLGFLPVKQEIFGTESGDLRQVLRDKLDSCEGLIQIIGYGYGAEPPTVDTEFGRVSYTQFEFLYARSRGKKTWLIFAGDNCTRDNPLHAIDLPWDKNNLDPLAHQAERRALQDAYRQQRAGDGHLFHPALGDADLLLKVEQLKNELEHLRRAETEWRTKVSRTLAALFALLLVIAVGVWWKGDDFMRWMYQDSKPTESRVREHLVGQEEKNYQDALLAGEKIDNLEERRKYLADVKEQHEARLFRINSLVENFESLATGSHASVVMEELASIISVQGEAAGLEYMKPLQAGILERVKARPSSAHQENRDDLLPLLIMALLQAAQGDAQSSAALFDQILNIEPDWPDARYFHFWYLIAMGEQALSDKRSDDAEREFLKARETVEHSLQLEPKNGQTKHDLIFVLTNLGDIYDRRHDPEKATAEYKLALKYSRELAETIKVNRSGERDVSFVLNRLGTVALNQLDYKLADEYFSESLEIADDLAASDRSREGWQYDLMFTLQRVGETALLLNQLDRAKQQLSRSLQFAEQFVKSHPGDMFYQSELANSLGLLGEVYTARNELAESEKTYERVLEIDRDLLLAKPDDKRLQRDLSITLNKLGKVKIRLRKYSEALAMADESVGIMELLVAKDKEYLGLQRDLVVPLRLRAEVLELKQDLPAAESTARQIVKITGGMAGTNAENDALQFEYQRSIGYLVAILIAEKKLEEAQKLISDSLPTIQKFSDAKLPDRALNEWRRDHSVALNRLAEIALLKKEFEPAQAHGQAALTIIRAVAAEDRQNFNREQDLAYTLRQLGRIALERVTFDEANEFANEVLEIRQSQLVRFKDAAAQYDVALAYFDLAKIANRKKDELAETAYLKSCYEILRALHEKNHPILSPLDEVYPKLEELFEPQVETIPAAK